MQAAARSPDAGGLGCRLDQVGCVHCTMRAFRITATYLLSVALVLGTVCLTLESSGIGHEGLLALTIPAAAFVGFVVTGGLRGSLTAAAPKDSAATALWALAWILVGVLVLQSSAVANRFNVVVTVTVVTSALGEELAFRRFPVALQHRLGLLDARSTCVFAAMTTTSFVLIHDTTHLLPTIDKIAFSLCAYFACLSTRSVALPLGIHLSGNAVASLWVSQSGGVAAAWFSLASVMGSVLAIIGLLYLSELSSHGRVHSRSAGTAVLDGETI